MCVNLDWLVCLHGLFWHNVVLEISGFTGIFPCFCDFFGTAIQKTSWPGFCSFPAAQLKYEIKLFQHKTFGSEPETLQPVYHHQSILTACVHVCVWKSVCVCCQQATNACGNVQYSSARREKHTQLPVASTPSCITLRQTGMSVLASAHASLHCTERTEGFCLYCEVGQRQKSRRVIYGAGRSAGLRFPWYGVWLAGSTL